MENQIILRVEDNKNYFAKTSFKPIDIDIALDAIRDEYDESHDDMPEPRTLLELLVKKGYVTLVGEAPEIIDVTDW
jgi:hypothetical protein